jgi:hypothetical protein
VLYLGEYELALVWPVERIVEDNLHFRSNAQFAELYMPFDSLLFFAGAGTEISAHFRSSATLLAAQDVFVWDHENDSRRWVARSLQSYLEWWLSGKITI